MVKGDYVHPHASETEILARFLKLQFRRAVRRGEEDRKYLLGDFSHGIQPYLEPKPQEANQQPRYC